MVIQHGHGWQQLAGVDASPCDDVVMEYVDPATGGSAPCGGAGRGRG